MTTIALVSVTFVRPYNAKEDTDEGIISWLIGAAKHAVFQDSTDPNKSAAVSHFYEIVVIIQGLASPEGSLPAGIIMTFSVLHTALLFAVKVFRAVQNGGKVSPT